MGGEAQAEQDYRDATLCSSPHDATCGCQLRAGGRRIIDEMCISVIKNAMTSTRFPGDCHVIALKKVLWQQAGHYKNAPQRGNRPKFLDGKRIAIVVEVGVIYSLIKRNKLSSTQTRG